jgi:hypothetical protein
LCCPLSAQRRNAARWLVLLADEGSQMTIAARIMLGDPT